MQPTNKKSKKSTENVTSVSYHPIGGKRVVATMQPSVPVRSRKHVQADVHVTTQNEIPIHAVSGVLPATNQDEIIAQHTTSQDSTAFTANTHEGLCKLFQFVFGIGT